MIIMITRMMTTTRSTMMMMAIMVIMMMMIMMMMMMMTFDPEQEVLRKAREGKLKNHRNEENLNLITIMPKIANKKLLI